MLRLRVAVCRGRGAHAIGVRKRLREPHLRTEGCSPRSTCLQWPASVDPHESYAKPRSSAFLTWSSAKVSPPSGSWVGDSALWAVAELSMDTGQPWSSVVG
jgi:hypothetical protein